MGNQRRPQSPGVSGNQQVVVPNGTTDALQLSTYLTVVPVCLLLEWQDVDSFQYLLQLPECPRRAV